MVYGLVDPRIRLELMADVARSPIALLAPTRRTLRLVWRRLRRNWLSTIAARPHRR